MTCEPSPNPEVQLQPSSAPLLICLPAVCLTQGHVCFNRMEQSPAGRQIRQREMMDNIIPVIPGLKRVWIRGGHL